jgi:transposase InsO family protein
LARAIRKKIHRLWREEGLQVRVHRRRKRAGVSSMPSLAADASNVVWAIDFQFDSTIDGKSIKIASMKTNTPAAHCCTSSSARSPPNDSSPSLRTPSPQPAAHRKCCA